MTEKKKRTCQRMHIPLTRDEIADFLKICPAQVEILWSAERLRRSLHCDFRTHLELSHSSIYDVLEFALAEGHLPISLSRELSARWTQQLAEADEWEAFERATINEREAMLSEAGQFDGLSDITPGSDEVVKTLVQTQFVLLQLCFGQR